MQTTPSTSYETTTHSVSGQLHPVSALTLLAEARFMLALAACIGLVGYLILPDASADYAQATAESGHAPQPGTRARR